MVARSHVRDVQVSATAHMIWLTIAGAAFIVGGEVADARAPKRPTIIVQKAPEPWYVAEKNCVEVYRTCRARAKFEGVKATTFESEKK